MLKITMQPVEGQKKGAVKKVDVGDGADFAIEKQGIRYHDTALNMIFMLTWDKIKSVELEMEVSPAQVRYAKAFNMVRSENNKAAGLSPVEQAKASARLMNARAEVNG